MIAFGNNGKHTFAFGSLDANFQCVNFMGDLHTPHSVPYGVGFIFHDRGAHVTVVTKLDRTA